MKKLLLVDGSNLSFRMYFALESTQMTSPKGQPSWAIFGFLKILLEVFQKESADACIAVFDTAEPNFRKKQFSYYKANRPEQMPEALALQWPEIIRALQLIGIKIVQKAGLEADDLIGTIAAQAELRNDWQTQILTGDKDCLQLVSSNTSVLMPLRAGGYKNMNREEVYADLGVYPEQVVDLKALAGDSSDNIKGVPGIGQKTAVKLLEEFNNLEELYQNLHKVHSASQVKKLSENKQVAFDSQFLARIKVDCELDFSITPEDLKIEAKAEELTLFLVDYRLKNLQKKLPEVFPELKSCLDKFNNESSPSPSPIIKKIKEPSQKLQIERETVLEEKRLLEIFSKLKDLGEFSLDLETSGLDTFSCQILGWAFSWKENRAKPENKEKEEKIFKAAYVPVAHQYLGVPSQISNTTVVEAFRDLLGQLAPQTWIVLQNAKYEYKILKRFGLDLSTRSLDIMLASYVENPENYHGLKRQATRVFQYRMQLIEELAQTETTGRSKKKPLDLSKLDVEKVSNYACDDAALTLALFEFYLKNLTFELKELWLKIENPLVFVLAEMERKGVFLDCRKLQEISDELGKRIRELDSQIREKLEFKELNLSSTQQLGKALKQRGFTLKRTTSSGNFSTNSEILEELAKKDQSGLIEKIIEFRALSKLKSTYTENLLKLVRTDTKRLHGEFNQIFTATGRLSSSNPNLQNIPIRNEKYGALIRSTFIPQEKEGVLISADYSQIELRVLAHYTNDPVLQEAFTKNQDIHARTAAAIFNKDIKEVSEKERRIGKTLNFALLYQQGARATAKQLEISLAEAQEFIRRYFNTFQTVRQFMEEVLESARQKNYVETLWGRRRYFKNLNSKIPVLRKAEERAAFNFPLQGSAADIIKIAMLEINKKLPGKAEIILQVHDELVIETSSELSSEIISLLKKEMTNADLFKLRVPLLVEVSSGKSWQK